MSSDNYTGRLTIDKFTGENFHLWKFKMQALLKAKSLWSPIKQTLPLDTCDQHACRKEGRATHACAESCNCCLGLEKAERVVMEDGDGMLEHINIAKMMAEQLKAIGAKSRANDLTLEFLTARLLHEETRCSEGQDGSGKDGRAFNGRSRIGNTTMKKAEGPCFYCGKEGHFKKECRKRLAAELQSSEANQAFGHEAFAFSATSSRRGHWIIKSGVTAHDQQQSLVEQLATSQQC
ncbi:hypothetical protein PhCBS80983_g06434 [Powellomyces hirtus]|uniref:CCHC-type domain-containing protein n=1 Tax=Powellomyces hirtus TaxID=109895 RepID=A0A507DPP4_9FUNG|nr:hypothetical protein PhCBS80983_g06434 [Powellomyces hirtus]